MQNGGRCAVIGGANIDIGGFPEGIVAMGDSNPGRVRLSAGGVGRNIACNLARLGVETHLLTALGGDAFSEVIRADCRTAGVRLDMAVAFEGEASSFYLFIADSAGDMRLAVNDMQLCSRLTPEVLAPCLDRLNAMDAVVLDANLPLQSLAWIAENVRAPLIADAVSSVKAARLLPAIGRLSILKPNALEAAALTGMRANDPASAEAAARHLVEMGAAQVFITLGERGVCCADSRESRFVPVAPAQVVNTTGAGDAFTAALTWAKLMGFSLEARARAGAAAASLAVECPQTVNAALTAEAVLERMRRGASTN